MEEDTRVTITVQAMIICLFCIAVLAGAITTMQDAMPANGLVSGQEMPVECVDIKERKVALSFDTAGGNENIGTILKKLEENDVRATFFLTGEWVSAYPDDVKAMAQAGHDLGNHSQSHREMGSMSRPEIRQELMKVHAQVKELTGIEMNLFRPPYGTYSSVLIKTALSCGYDTVLWSVESFDWKNYGVNEITEQVLSDAQLKPGAIIWMNSGAKYTPSAIDALIAGLRGKGYELVPVSELKEEGET